MPLNSHKIILGFALSAKAVPGSTQVASGKPDESWTTTTQTASENASPVRTTESFKRIGNRTIHKVTTQVLGPSGQYQPYSENETEIVQESAGGSRSIVRSYSPGENGEMRLIQTAEENKQQGASGELHVVRTLSNPDEYGQLRVIQREVADTKKSGANSERTQSTVFTPDMNGSLVPTSRMLEEKKQGPNGIVEAVQTTTIPDLSGNWQVSQRVQRTQKTEGQNQTTEMVTLRPDFEGKLSEVSRTTTKESSANGQTSQTTQTLSPYLPGVAPDGTLHLVEQATTVQKKTSGGTTTEKRIQSRDPLDGNMKLMMNSSNSVVSGSSGTKATTTTSARGLDGGMSIVSSETSQSTQIPIEVQNSPEDQKAARPQK